MGAARSGLQPRVAALIALALLAPVAPGAAADPTEPVTVAVSDVAGPAMADGLPGMVSGLFSYTFNEDRDAGSVLPLATVHRGDHPDAFEGLSGAWGELAAWLAPAGVMQLWPETSLLENLHVGGQLGGPFPSAAMAAGDHVDMALAALPKDVPLAFDTERGDADGRLEWDAAVDVRTVTASYGDLSGSMDVVLIRADIVARDGDVDARSRPVELPPLVIDLPQRYPEHVVAASNVTRFSPYASYVHDSTLRVFPALGKAALLGSATGYIPEARERRLASGARIREWHIPIRGVLLIPTDGVSLTDGLQARALLSVPQGGVTAAGVTGGGEPPPAQPVPAGGAVLVGPDGVEVAGAGVPEGADEATGSVWDDLEAATAVDHTLEQPVDLRFSARGHAVTVDPDFRGTGTLALHQLRSDAAEAPVVETLSVPLVVVDGQAHLLTRDRLTDLVVRPGNEFGMIRVTGGAGEPMRRVRMSHGRFRHPGLDVVAVYELGDDLVATVAHELEEYIPLPGSFRGGLLRSDTTVRRRSGEPVAVQRVSYAELPAGGVVRAGGVERPEEFTVSAGTVFVGDHRAGHSTGTVTVLQAPAAFWPVPEADTGKPLHGGRRAIVHLATPASGPVPLAGTAVGLDAGHPVPDPDPPPLGQPCGPPQVVGQPSALTPAALAVQEAWLDSDGVRLYATVRLGEVPASAPPESVYRWWLSWRAHHDGYYARVSLNDAGTWGFDAGRVRDGGFRPPFIAAAGEASQGPDGVVRVSIPLEAARLQPGDLVRDPAAHATWEALGRDTLVAREPAGSSFDHGTGGDYRVGACP